MTSVDPTDLAAQIALTHGAWLSDLQPHRVRRPGEPSRGERSRAYRAVIAGLTAHQFTDETIGAVLGRTKHQIQEVRRSVALAARQSWGVGEPRGGGRRIILRATIRPTRPEAIKAFGGDWLAAYRRGYRCERVAITPAFGATP